MKTGRTLQQLAVELDRQNAAKRDFIVGANAMQMEDGGGLFSLTRPLDSGIREVTPFEMTGLFHRQLGDTLGIPAKYYDRCRADYPELLSRNVNGWLEKSDKRHMVRTLDNTARAFLSDKYRRIDNYEIAQNVLPIIGEMPDARVESCEVTDNRMYIKVVNPRLESQVAKGDIVQAGVVISNSEVGLGSVSVMPLIFRLACLNGMCVNDAGQRKYHVGRQNDESWELFSNETLLADDRAFMLKLSDIVRTAVDEAKFAMIVDRLREAAETKITGPIDGAIIEMSRQFGFNKTEGDGILQHLIEGGDLSLWGLSNAVTRTAADVESYDRATVLENAGWQVATMHPKMWREINGWGSDD